ncbi:MAG: 3-deoxy-7-phosphoheptulonate synthase, partial [Intestinibacter bartlettii]|nr:3-deoxy-7-phosphoheptulonate synthase [Intestinibacter bartlettii]MDU4257419.1 3-deoxy-7-phosphoheptulonate synthase [Intestinibacter bartlettii]MDU6472948.1 3-deoxy-7-phosphoheptulonate synthase [Intestinibacter bartlettii]MDU6535429.1 3-deoxy-7-phosphoheptulonate synthase [Intestinibacter bartlettii]
AVGADGLMIEVHNNPAKALCDGKQSIKPETFDEIMKKIKVYTELEGAII